MWGPGGRNKRFSAKFNAVSGLVCSRPRPLLSSPTLHTGTFVIEQCIRTGSRPGPLTQRLDGQIRCQRASFCLLSQQQTAGREPEPSQPTFFYIKHDG